MLAPWQEEALSAIFGNLDDDGNRQIETVYLEVEKKTGKTEFAAGIILLVTALEKTPGCQVYGAAAGQRQSLNVYRAACKMVEQSPILKKHLRILRGTSRIMKRSDPDSFYAAIAADGDMTDGVNPMVTVADEVHRWKTRKQQENHDVLSLGGITRKQALTINITTAGVQSESPIAWRLHEKTQRINQGIISDPKFYGRIYAADPKDDWTKEETWIRANPSLKQNGGFLDIQKYHDEYNKTLSDPEAQRAFKRYFLNIWDQQDERALDMGQWDACARPWDAVGLLPKDLDNVRPLETGLLSRFIEKKAFAGVDLSLTTDFTSVCFVFPQEKGFIDVLPFFWLPEEGLRRRQLRDGMPYQKWADEGFLELSKGNVIDYRDVQARLEWGTRMFDIQKLCFDKYQSRQISVPMTEEGHPCIEVPQSFTGLSEACKKVLSLVASGKLRHGGHPILRWNASCLSIHDSRDDQIKWSKPERAKDSSRIDGIAALTTALAGGAMIELNQQPVGIDSW